MPALVETALMKGLQKHLSQFNYEYLITEVTRYDLESDAEALKLTSFCFSVIPTDEINKRPGTIMMRISVDGGSGQMPSGQTSLEFTPCDVSQNPIPAGCTASVIFRHDMMANKIFKVGLDTLT